MTLETHNFDPGILREYDIRGIVGSTLKEADCYFTGRAFGTELRRLGAKTVAVGFDGRKSSPAFCNEVIRGLNMCGLNVENVGLGPTPMVYFAMKSRGLDAAVVVTGSHGPVSSNG
ncbi:MAG: phosphomannomutase, partial [Alphaproteobacteria bacterium]|nr:phosphomannomutase [Alphaproteobacteria bacterium]